MTDLTEHCGVNRMTFYYHFKDIYDLVEWACIESATRALAGQKTYDTWQQGFLQILQAVQKDKVFVTKVYHSISREHIENYLYRLTYDLMIGVVEEKAAGMTVRPRTRSSLRNFYKYAFVGLTLEVGAHRHEGRPRRPHRAGIDPYPRGYYKGSGGVPDR